MTGQDAANTADAIIYHTPGGGVSTVQQALDNSSSSVPVGSVMTFDGSVLPGGYEPYQTQEQRDIATLNDNLNGFKFYPTGTQIVGLISDDSAYTDEDGNYVVWGTATANQLVADNPNTYKSVASTEDCRGEVGADTGSPFKSGINPDIFPNSVTMYCDAYGRGYLTNSAGVTNIPTFGVYKKITQSYSGSYTDLMGDTVVSEYDEAGNVTTTNKGRVSTFTHNLLDTTMYVTLTLSSFQGYKGKDSDYSISRTITLSKS